MFLESLVFTVRGFKRLNERCRAETVIRRCAETDVVRSTEPSPSLTRNWEYKHQREQRCRNVAYYGEKEISELRYAKDVNITCVKIGLCVNFKDDALHIIQAAEHDSDI